MNLGPKAKEPPDLRSQGQAQMARTEKREAAQREQFLAALSETASVTRACEITGLPRRTVYNWRATDPEFAQAWEVALDLGTDALEDEAIRRAYARDREAGLPGQGSSSGTFATTPTPC